jgi:hypothetical protein
LVRLLSQINLFHTVPLQPFVLCFNIIPYLRLGPYNQSAPFRMSHQNPVHISLSPTSASTPQFHAPLFHYSSHIGRGVLIIKQFIIKLFLQSPVFPSLLRLILFLSTFFSNIYNLGSSLNIRGQVLHP